MTCDFLSLLLFVYYIYFYISSVATGIQFSGFPPEFFVNIATQLGVKTFEVVETDDRDYTVTVTNTSDTYSGKCSVPVYVSKPYGSYAKSNGIQVPSVELVDFGKTGVLAPGGSETLTITVDEKYFAFYDAYSAKGYVLMDGTSNIRVTNLFDFADLNLYEGRGDNHVDYYSRDNWAAVSFDIINGHVEVVHDRADGL